MIRGVLAVFLVVGCAPRHPTRVETLRAVGIAVKSAAIAHEQRASDYDRRARERLEHCERLDLPTAAERRECLAGFSSFTVYAEHARQFSESYDRIVVELERARELARALDAADRQEPAP
jgi:hypothetical protein